MTIFGIKLKRPHPLEIIIIMVLISAPTYYREQLSIILGIELQQVKGLVIAMSTGAILNACGLTVRKPRHRLIITVFCAISALMALIIFDFLS